MTWVELKFLLLTCYGHCQKCWPQFICPPFTFPPFLLFPIAILCLVLQHSSLISSSPSSWSSEQLLPDLVLLDPFLHHFFFLFFSSLLRRPLVLWWENGRGLQKMFFNHLLGLFDTCLTSSLMVNTVYDYRCSSLLCMWWNIEDLQHDWIIKKNMNKSLFLLE